MTIPDPAPAIAKATRAFERHFAARDARSLVKAYYLGDAHDPLASPPGDVIILGHDGLLAMLEEQFGFARSIALTLHDLEVSGDMAFERGRAELTLTDGGIAKGRYVALWLWRDGAWGVKTDVFTLDG